MKGYYVEIMISFEDQRPIIVILKISPLPLMQLELRHHWQLIPVHLRLKTKLYPENGLLSYKTY